MERGTLELLLGKLEADVVDGTLAGACLDALLALLADSNTNQAKFLDLGGVGKVDYATTVCHAVWPIICAKQELQPCTVLQQDAQRSLHFVATHVFTVLYVCAQVCSVLLHQYSPSCQILCCKAINLLVTHILGPHAKAAAEELERQMGTPSAQLLARPIHWTQRGVLEMQLQHLATCALAKLPT